MYRNSHKVCQHLVYENGETQAQYVGVSEIERQSTVYSLVTDVVLDHQGYSPNAENSHGIALLLSKPTI